MSSREDRQEPALDPALEAWLRDARAADADADADLDVASMLRAVEGDIGRAEAKKTFWLRTRSTTLRRTLAAGAAVSLVVLGGVIITARAPAELAALPMVLATLALAALLGLAVHLALRPLHRPPLSRAARAATVGLTLGATFLVALLSPHGGEVYDDASLVAHVGPCLFYGLLFGVPVYLLLRLLDRGEPSTSILAACAAGLLGDLVLQLHCPRADLEHLMLAHFGVALLFVAGLGGAHALARGLR